MLRYCAWCGEYQGAVEGRGHQIRKNVCEIDTTTICPSCLTQFLEDTPEIAAFRLDAWQPSRLP